MDTTIANPNPAPEKVLARTSGCMRRLLDAGLTFDDLQLPINDPKMRARLVAFWKAGGVAPKLWTTPERARDIMGKNFFGIEEARWHLKVTPSEKELAVFARVPYSEATLEECKNTHVLDAYLPLSINDLTTRAAVLFELGDKYR